MIETMAASRGPACSLPVCIQFLRPRATGVTTRERLIKFGPLEGLCEVETRPCFYRPSSRMEHAMFFADG
jgi:hypothetical protein